MNHSAFFFFYNNQHFFNYNIIILFIKIIQAKHNYTTRKIQLSINIRGISSVDLIKIIP